MREDVVTQPKRKADIFDFFKAYYLIVGQNSRDLHAGGVGTDVNSSQFHYSV